MQKYTNAAPKRHSENGRQPTASAISARHSALFWHSIAHTAPKHSARFSPCAKNQTPPVVDIHSMLLPITKNTAQNIETVSFAPILRKHSYAHTTADSANTITTILLGVTAPQI